MHNSHLRRYPFAVFFAKPDEGSGSEKPQTLEEKFTALKSERDELAGKVSPLESSILDLTRERDEARNEVATIKPQFEAATAAANEAQAKLTESEGKVTALTSELSETKTKLTRSQENITRLESLCGVKGIDPSSAAPNLGFDPSAPGQEISNAEKLRNAMEENNKISDPKARADHHAKNIAPLLKPAV